MNLTKSIKQFLLVICVLALMLMLLPVNVAYASSPIGDGKYEVPIINDLPMGADNFSDKATVEKQGNHYYMTFTIFDSTQVKDFRLELGNNEVGHITQTSGKQTKYIYTLSEKNITSSLTFKGFVPAMNKEITANIKLDFNSSKVKKLNKDIDYIGDRPAEFVPSLEINLSDCEVEKGTSLLVPTAEAKLDNTSIGVTTTAYYVDEGNNIDVDIVNNRLLLKNIGEYHIVYRAESDKYKTLQGKNTSKEINIKIISKVGASSIAKFEDNSKILPTDAGIQANYISSGDIFDKAKQQIKSVADNFEVINVDLFTASGEKITLLDKLSIYLRCNDSYNRNNVIVYHMDNEGNLTELQSENYGRYVKVDTDKTGTFIVANRGVKFVMPMWAYAVITAVVALIVIAVIVVVVVKVKKKKKSKNKEDKKY